MNEDDKIIMNMAIEQAIGCAAAVDIQKQRLDKQLEKIIELEAKLNDTQTLLLELASIVAENTKK